LAAKGVYHKTYSTLQMDISHCYRHQGLVYS